MDKELRKAVAEAMLEADSIQDISPVYDLITAKVIDELGKTKSETWRARIETPDGHEYIPVVLVRDIDAIIATLQSQGAQE